jgi:hypothetical protein
MSKLLSIKLRNLAYHQMCQMRTPLMAIQDLFLVALLRVLKWDVHVIVICLELIRLLNSYLFSLKNKKEESFKSKHGRLFSPKKNKIFFL